MERIALTANGNLQRIFSSYYDSPVRVIVDRCSRRRRGEVRGDEEGDDGRAAWRDEDVDHDDIDGIWNRVVRIQVRDVSVCRATSVIRVRCPRCRRLIDDGTVGIAQLFRYLDRLPTFTLIDAGRRTGECGIGRNAGGGGGSDRGEEGGEGTPFVNDDDDDNHDDGFGVGGIWRTYELRSEEITCLIHEEFRCDAWDVMI
jgi:hypothetical protein